MHLSQAPLANLAQLTPLGVSNGDLQVQIPPSPCTWSYLAIENCNSNASIFSSWSQPQTKQLTMRKQLHYTKKERQQ